MSTGPKRLRNSVASSSSDAVPFLWGGFAVEMQYTATPQFVSDGDNKALYEIGEDLNLTDEREQEIAFRLVERLAPGSASAGICWNSQLRSTDPTSRGPWPSA